MSAHRTILRTLAPAAITAAAAYAGARLAHRSTRRTLEHLATAVEYLADRIQIDYWRAYGDGQRDMLAGEE